MKSPHTTARKKLLALLVLLACAAALLALRSREPRYNDRPLSTWLQQYANARTANESLEAQHAICSIGIKRSLPTLLKLITAKGGAIDDLVFKMKAKFGLHFLPWRYAPASNLYGLSGFEVLGTNAAPGVGALTQLLNDKDRSFVAFQCLEKIGKPAEGALCQCLTNQDWRIRISSVNALADVTDDAQTYISRVKACLNDSNSGVRVAAVRAIGSKYPQAHHQVVPFLMTLLNDPDPDIRMSATEILKQLDPRAAANAGIK